MTLQVSTWAGDMITTSGQSTQSTNITGTNIVSVGVQTNNTQDSFVITQMFVSDNGSQAYIQITNNQFGNIGWWPWVVNAYDSGAASERVENKCEVETAKALTKK